MKQGAKLALAVFALALDKEVRTALGMNVVHLKQKLQNSFHIVCAGS
jgi:hypothetical protein